MYLFLSWLAIMGTRLHRFGSDDVSASFGWDCADKDASGISIQYFIIDLSYWATDKRDQYLKCVPLLSS